MPVNADRQKVTIPYSRANKEVTQMTGTQAINKAMAVFNKEGKGDIRTVALMEGSGCGNKWSQITIHIGYAINGDYTESDKNPFEVNVYESDGKIKAERIR